MNYNATSVKPIEKIISILSYLSMGIIGLIWFLIAYYNKKNLKYFLMYNISQSMVIAIFLAIIKLILNIIIPILWIIPVINNLASILNFIFSVKIIRLYFIDMSFSIFEFLVFILLLYIIIGILNGRIFHIPLLTKIMKNAMKNYN